MRKRNWLLGLLTVVALMAGLLPLTAMAVNRPESPEPIKACYEQVAQDRYERTTYTTETKYKKETFREEVRYEKFVKGKIEKKKRGNWEVIGTFDWIDWPGAGPLAWGVIPDPMSGDHNSIFDSTGNTRKRSTHFQYQIVNKRQVSTGFVFEWFVTDPGAPWVSTGKTRQVNPVVESSEWLPDGQVPEGDGWEWVEERIVDGEAIVCFGFDTQSVCGLLTANITFNNSKNGGAFVQAVLGTTPPSSNDYPWEGVALAPLDQANISVNFSEDQGGGEVTVTVFAHGPEQNDYAVDGVSTIYKTLTIDTNCQDDVIDDPTFESGNESASCDPETGEFVRNKDGFITLNPGDHFTWDGASQTGLEAGDYGPFTATAAAGYTFAEGKTFSTGGIEILLSTDRETCEKLVTPVAPEVTQSDACDVEGFFTIPETEGVIYLVDGEPVSAGTVISGSGQFNVTAIAADGYELTKELDVTIIIDPAQECATAVMPEVTEGEACEVADFFVIPETEGVNYLVNGAVVEAGTKVTGPGTFTVTAQAIEGYELTNPDFMVGINLDAGEPCPTMTTPTTTPEDLPFTGMDSASMGLMALVLVALGGLVLALSRKVEA